MEVNNIAQKRILSDRVTEVLICPKCKGGVLVTPDSILCKICRQRYPVIKGIPSLLCELTDKERDQLVIHENVFSGKKLRFYNRYMSNAFLTLIHNDYVSVIINKRLDANKLVLDIGCGSGNVGKKIINSGAHLISMDIALNAVSEARNALGNSGKDFIQSSVLRIPIEDSAVDVIIGHFILHHIDDIKKAVSEIRRVLTPDGYMVFVEPTERLTWLELWLDFFKIPPVIKKVCKKVYYLLQKNFARHKWGKVTEDPSEGTPEKHFYKSSDEYGLLLKEAGFTEIRVENIFLEFMPPRFFEMQNEGMVRFLFKVSDLLINKVKFFSNKGKFVIIEAKKP